MLERFKKKGPPKVSVIMPVYNGLPYIKKSIISVFNQTFKDFEIIIVDDASTDKSYCLLKTLNDPRIVLLKHKKNKGTSASRNAALRKARGQYIAYCDQDDIWYKNHLKEMVPILDNRPDVGLVFAKYRLTGKYKPGWLSTVYPEGKFSKEGIESENIIGAPLNILHRKECINRVGDFSENEPIATHSCEDWDLWLRISDSFKIYHLNKVLGKFIFHGKNRSESADFIKSSVYLVKKRIKKYKSENRPNYYALCVIFRLSLVLITINKKNDYWQLIKNRLLDFKNKRYKGVIYQYCQGLDFYIKGKFIKARSIFKKCLFWFKKNKSLNRTIIKNAILVLTYLLAQCEAKLANSKEAVKLHRKVLRQDKNFFASRENLALLYFQSKDYKKFSKISKELLSHSSFIRGLYFFQKKQYQRAISSFDEILNTEPNFTPAKNNLELAKFLSGPF